MTASDDHVQTAPNDLGPGPNPGPGPDPRQVPHAPDLVSLVGSRIAHDLNNPVGAIANGIELLGLTGQMDGPELALINESVENARRRIKSFRIAFGAAAPGQVVAAAEIAELTAPGADGRRLEIDWPVAEDLPRRDAKTVFLALMCLESAMPWGGRVQVRAAPGGWQLAATADRVRLEPAHWHILEEGPLPADLSANAVHFALLAREIGIRGRPITLARTETAISLGF